MRRRPGILFLCIENSARSQLAEGLARAMLGDRAVVQSAGICPSTMHPYVIEVMKEVGVDLTGQVPKSIASIDTSTVDLVVTLGTEEVCPVTLVNVRRFQWPMPDPGAGAADLSPDELLHKFRSTRDVILRRLDQLVVSELLL